MTTTTRVVTVAMGDLKALLLQVLVVLEVQAALEVQVALVVQVVPVDLVVPVGLVDLEDPAVVEVMATSTVNTIGESLPR